MSYRLFGFLRFVLAMMVAVNHAAPTFGFNNAIALFPWGGIAVTCFFVLSGFIIAEAIGTYYLNRPFAYLFNRMLRILPPYWLALLVSIVTHVVLSQSGSLSIYNQHPTAIFSLQNIVANITAVLPFQGAISIFHLNTFYGFVSYYWAILIEVDFYLVAFLIVLIGGFFKSKFTPFVVLCIAAFLALHLVNEYIRPIRSELHYIPYFTLGVCIYGWRTGRRLAGFGIVLSALAAAPAFALNIDEIVSVARPGDHRDLNAIMAAGGLALFCVAIFLLSNTKATGRLRAIDRWFGDLSYPIYLNHYIVLTTLFSLGVTSWTALLIFIAGSLALAWIAAVAVEIPLRHVRDAIRGHSL